MKIKYSLKQIDPKDFLHWKKGDKLRLVDKISNKLGCASVEHLPPQQDLYTLESMDTEPVPRIILRKCRIYYYYAGNFEKIK